MDKINELIILLTAIQSFSKDIHYNCKGDAFYSKHLLCDRISENIYDYIDSLKEVCFLAASETPLPSKEYLQKAIYKIPDISGNDRYDFSRLLDLISETLQTIQDLDNLTMGEENLIGNIAENLQTSMGLLNRQVMNG